MLQPLRSTTVDDLLSEPHQADEGAQSAGDHEAALETICKEVLSARRGSKSIISSQPCSSYINEPPHCSSSLPVICFYAVLLHHFLSLLYLLHGPSAAYLPGSVLAPPPLTGVHCVDRFPQFT